MLRSSYNSRYKDVGDIALPLLRSASVHWCSTKYKVVHWSLNAGGLPNICRAIFSALVFITLSDP